MIESTKIKFGGREWTASLDFQQIINLLPAMQKIAACRPGTLDALEDVINACFEVIVVGLSRYHPEITKGELEKLLSLPEIDKVKDEVLEMVLTFWRKRKPGGKVDELPTLLKKLTRTRCRS